MSMYVFLKGTKYAPWAGPTPIAVEYNLEFAIPYWTKRQKVQPRIYWEIK